MILAAFAENSKCLTRDFIFTEKVVVVAIIIEAIRASLLSVCAFLSAAETTTGFKNADMWL